MYEALEKLNIHQMVVFVTVARTKNFSETAELLCLSQPAVSKSILKLEQILGVPLFNRTTRKIELTPQGTILYKNWQYILNNLSTSYEEVIDFNGKRKKEVRAALSSMINPYKYFWPLIEEFEKKYPDIHIGTESDSMVELTRKLINGNADIVFLPDFQHYELERHQLCWKWAAISNVNVIVSKDNPLSKKKRLNMEDINGASVSVLLSAQNQNYIQDLEKMFRDQGATFFIRRTFQNEYELKNSYRAGDGILLVDEYFSFDENEKTCRIPLNGQYNGIICGWRYPFANEYVRAFVDAIQPQMPVSGSYARAPEYSFQ